MWFISKYIPLFGMPSQKKSILSTTGPLLGGWHVHSTYRFLFGPFIGPACRTVYNWHLLGTAGSPWCKSQTAAKLRKLRLRDELRSRPKFRRSPWGWPCAPWGASGSRAKVSRSASVCPRGWCCSVNGLGLFDVFLVNNWWLAMNIPHPKKTPSLPNTSWSLLF